MNAINQLPESVSASFIDAWLQAESPGQRQEFLCVHRLLITDEAVQAMKAAVSQRLRQDPQDALDLAESMLFAADLSGQPMHRAWALMAKGNVQRILAQYQDAIATYDMARSICLEQNRVVEAERPQIAKVAALTYIGRFEEALQLAEEARRVFDSHGEVAAAAVIDYQAGITAYKLGDYPKSLALFDRARQALDQASEANLADAIYIDLNRSIVELNRSVVLRNLDRFTEAKTAAIRARTMAAQRHLSVNAARADQSLGITNYFLGKYNEALKLFDKARQVFASSGLKREVFIADLFATNCHLAVNRYVEALELAQNAEQALMQLDMHYEVAWAAYSCAQAHIGLGQVVPAADALARARVGFAQIENQVWVATVDIQWAVLNLKIGIFDAALANSQRAGRVFAREELVVEKAQADFVAAEALAALERDTEARRLCLSVLDVAIDRDVPWLANQAHHLLGRLAEVAEDQMVALAHYEACAAGVEDLRCQVAVELRGGFLADKGEIYEDIVNLKLVRSEVQQAFDYVERAKSRALVELLAHNPDIRVKVRSDGDRALVAHIERLRQECQWYYNRLDPFGEQEAAERGLTEVERDRLRGELRDREKQMASMLIQLQVRNADYIEDVDLWKVQVEKPQPYLDASTLLVEYYITRGEVMAFSVTGEEMQVHRRLTTTTKLNRWLSLLRLNLYRLFPNLYTSGNLWGNEWTNLQGLLGYLYAALIHPLADRLADFDRLIIVPHGPLHYLPFHALFDGRSYLLEQCEISYLPSSSVLRFCSGHQPVGVDSLSSLVLGCSVNGMLPHTLAEAERVAGLLLGTTLLEETATLANLRAQVKGSRIIHLATHGEFRPDAPLFSYLYLADGPLTTTDVFNLELDAALVTLSACQSGASVVGGGDELVGLSRAFLYAGATSLLMSLWRVEDQATAQLMDGFYQNILAGQRSAAALRQAQLNLLNSDEGSCYRHPYFWAPFFLVGGRGRVVSTQGS